MAKITLYLNEAQIRSEVSGILTSGMVGVEVKLVCDEGWNDLSKTLICRAGDVVKTVLVQNDRAVVAHETMVAGKWLELGVEGRNDDGSVVIPTLWERCCIVLPGADSSADQTVDPTLPIWMQLQKRVESLEVPHAPSDIGALPTPLAAEVGQYLRVAGVNSIGAVTQVEAVDAPKQNDDAVKTVNGIAPDENGNVQIPVSGGNVDLTGYATEQWVKEQNYLTEVPEDYAKSVGDALNGKLSKSGGTMTGKIVFPTADQNVGFANSEDMKIFGYGTFNGAMHMRMGDTAYPFQIRGNGDRPKYNNGVIALMGDIPTDDHINGLINTALGVIENGTY